MPSLFSSQHDLSVSIFKTKLPSKEIFIWNMNHLVPCVCYIICCSQYIGLFSMCFPPLYNARNVLERCSCSILKVSTLFYHLCSSQKACTVHRYIFYSYALVPLALPNTSHIPAKSAQKLIARSFRNPLRPPYLIGVFTSKPSYMFSSTGILVYSTTTGVCWRMLQLKYFVLLRISSTDTSYSGKRLFQRAKARTFFLTSWSIFLMKIILNICSVAETKDWKCSEGKTAMTYLVYFLLMHFKPLNRKKTERCAVQRSIRDCYRHFWLQYSHEVVFDKLDFHTTICSFISRQWYSKI